MTRINDEFLLQQITLGCQDALEVLFERYYNQLCEFAFSYVKSADIAEEVVSDVFTNLWLKREQILLKSKFKPYVYTSVRNKSIDYLNKNRRYFEDIEAIDSNDFNKDPEVLLALNMSELEKHVNDIIEELPLQRKTIFKLNRFEDLKYKDIANILNISVNTVQKQMTLAVKHIWKYQQQFEIMYLANK